MTLRVGDVVGRKKVGGKGRASGFYTLCAAKHCEIRRFAGYCLVLFVSTMTSQRVYSVVESGFTWYGGHQPTEAVSPSSLMSETDFKEVLEQDPIRDNSITLFLHKG
jgi:hypothetical protein